MSSFRLHRNGAFVFFFAVGGAVPGSWMRFGVRSPGTMLDPRAGQGPGDELLSFWLSGGGELSPQALPLSVQIGNQRVDSSKGKFSRLF